MTSLVLACAYFLGIHVVISGSSLRRTIVDRIGERPYLGLFSLLSLAGMVWMAQAYRHTATASVWGPIPGLRWLALVVTLIAFVFIVLGLTTPSPTATGGEAQLEAAEPVQGILRVTRHPFLWGVALWAVIHVALNGDAASLVLFGTVLLLAVIGPLLIDNKRRRRFGPSWERFAAATSNLPFAAIAAGRNQFRPGEIGPWRIVLAVAVYAVALAAHRWMFGVSPLPN